MHAGWDPHAKDSVQGKHKNSEAAVAGQTDHPVQTLDGISRASLHKAMVHHWHVIGEDRCKRALSSILSDEARRASGDHTYHAVSNLTGYDDQGKPVVLRASLYSILGQGGVLGMKVNEIFLR